jgi:hypothetical protein
MQNEWSPSIQEDYLLTIQGWIALWSYCLKSSIWKLVARPFLASQRNAATMLWPVGRSDDPPVCSSGSGFVANLVSTTI